MAAGIEPEAETLPATSTTGQAEANTGQIESLTGQVGTDFPPAHVEDRTKPVKQGSSIGHGTAPIAPPRDLLYLAWAWWPQVPEQMRQGIVRMVAAHLRSHFRG